MRLPGIACTHPPKLLLILFAPLYGSGPEVLASQNPPQAKEPPPASAPAKKKAKKKKQPKKAQRGWRLQFKRRPSLRYRDLLRADFRVKLQADLRTVTPEDPGDRDFFELHRNRIALEGTFLRDFEYEAEYDFARNELGLRDAYVNFRRWRFLQLQGGRFKIPFGRDQLTAPMNLDFVYRSRLGAEIAPAREYGFMLHGPLVGRGLRYQAGLFRHDGENAYAEGKVPIGGRTFAARLRSFPQQLLPLPALLRELEVGVAGTWNKLPSARASLNGHAASGVTFFPRMQVNGRRLRLGAEFNWSPGPFSLQGEYMRVGHERRQQGVRDEDLPEVIARGWYLAGTWLLTGETKAGGVEPRRPFWREPGLGAWELAFRQEHLRFGTTPFPRPPSSSPRAPTLFPASDRASTFGLNWYVNQYVKIQANLIREKVEAPYREMQPLWQYYWTRVCRLQFVM